MVMTSGNQMKTKTALARAKYKESAFVGKISMIDMYIYYLSLYNLFLQMQCMIKFL